MISLLDPIISSKTRAQLLLRLFCNPESSCYLRELSRDFSLSTNSIRCELNNLAKAKVITRFRKGREVHYKANIKYPLFEELVSIAKKILGIDRVIDNIVKQIGLLHFAVLMGDYAVGRDSGLIDLLLVGQIDTVKLSELVAITEERLDRKIRTLCLKPDEFAEMGDNLLAKPYLVLWQDEAAMAENHYRLPNGEQ